MRQHHLDQLRCAQGGILIQYFQRARMEFYPGESWVRLGRLLRISCVPEDPRDSGMRVLDVVDGVLLRPLAREIHVELDRLVVPA